MSSTLNVCFEVPKEIMDLLKEGVYERVGGVIRRKDNRRIVSWLLEASVAPEIVKPTLPNSLPSNCGAILLSTQLLTAVNVSLSIATLQKLQQVSEVLRTDISNLKEELAERFDEQTFAKIQAGIESSQIALQLTDVTAKMTMAGQALHTLFEARHLLRAQINRAVGRCGQSLIRLLVVALSTLSAETQVQMILEDNAVAAKMRMISGLEELRPILRKVVCDVRDVAHTFLRPEYSGLVDFNFVVWLFKAAHRLDEPVGSRQTASPVPSFNEVFETLRCPLANTITATAKVVDIRRHLPAILCPPEGGLAAGANAGNPLSFQKVVSAMFGHEKTNAPCWQIHQHVCPILGNICHLVEAFDRLAGQAIQLHQLEELRRKPSDVLQSLASQRAAVVVFK
jgi:hypothetical protein